ncbi:hypothetical protein ABT381_13475 [Streptomyces sp. NPDC000151]|uniref:hypothetical protein n=1 Tax=Streptomyces sp. NPDC000151 TaxID=3154244 RepID=UPI00331D6BE5
MRQGPRPTPPGTVFAASYLFAGVAALALVSAIGTLFAAPEFSHYRSERAGDESAGTLAAAGLVTFALLTIVFGAGCALLAFLDGRGRQPARVLTWVVGGLSGCFDIALLAVSATDSVPWYGGMTRVVTSGMLVLTVASLTLLALPASHGYFRESRPARQHPQPLPVPAPVQPPPPPAVGQVPPPSGHLPQPPSYPPSPYGYPSSPYGYQPQQPQPQSPLPRVRRPAAVTAAMAVLMCLAVLAVVGAVVEVLTYQAILGHLDDYMRTVREQTAKYGVGVAFPSLPRSAVGPTAIVVVALGAMAATLAGLALALRLPRPRARVVTLVVVGLLAPLATARAFVTMTTQATLEQLAASSERLRESMGGGGRYRDMFPGVDELYPQWAYTAVYLTSALAVVGCVAVFVLLTVRGSAAWFGVASHRVRGR